MKRQGTVAIDFAAPTCLIAMPKLGDPVFAHAVVLILAHGKDGSMGLLLNRPGTLSVFDFCQNQKMQFLGNKKHMVNQGGPVQTDRAFILHTSEIKGPETESILDNVCLSYSLESLQQLTNDPPEGVRIFLGYAGWGPDQLATEINAGAWLVAQPDVALIFKTPIDKLWDKALSQQGISPLQLMYSGVLH